MSGIVVKGGGFIGDPLHKVSDFWMRLQSSPIAVSPGQFALAQGRVDFAVADSVDKGFGFAALAFGNKMVFVHTGAYQQRSAAQWAIGRVLRFDKT